MLARTLPALRLASTRACRGYKSRAVVYETEGDPLKVLHLQDEDVPSPREGEAQVEMLAAPINPSDINQIEGKYPIRPQLPAVAGNEGLGIVTGLGVRAAGLQEGSWVVPLQAGLGTWRDAANYPASLLHPIPPNLPFDIAATLTINPPTALHLLDDFVDLQEGDVIIQNGANSIVGQLVVQIAAIRGIRTVNIVRDRPDLEKLRDEMSHLGATVVTTELDVRDAMGEANLPKAKLGLNCVGGTASTAVARALREKGVLVTYGGMSMKPVILPTSLFIFKDITAKGFWLSGAGRSKEESAAYIDKVVQLVREHGLKIRTEHVPLDDYKGALTKERFGLLAEKQILLPEKGAQLLAVK